MNIMEEVNLMNKAFRKINEIVGCNLAASKGHGVGSNDWQIIVADLDMQAKMDKMKRKGFSFLDYIPTFDVYISERYFDYNILDPYDREIGIKRNMPLEDKAILRISYRVLFK